MTSRPESGGFARLETTKSYQAVVNQVKAKIYSGELRPGSSLPTERTLCDELGVSRSTVREAMRSLEALGIIEVTRGKGPASGARIRTVASPVLSELLSLNIALHGWTLSDLILSRTALERQSVAWAAGAAPSRLLAIAPAIEESLTLMTEECTPSEYYPVDADFHLMLANISGNPVMNSLMQGLRGAISDVMLKGFESMPDWRSAQERLTCEHTQIWEAIRAGDGGEAARLVERHIIDFYREALADFDASDGSFQRVLD